MFQSSVLVPDALVAMETNLKAILAMFGVKVSRLECGVDAHSGTASIVHTKDYSDALNVFVRFPALKTTQRLTRAELDRWTGYFIHEICHALWTDESAWAVACREGLSALVNGMEDVRIERRMIESARVDNAKSRLVELMDFVSSRPAPKGAQEYDSNNVKSLPWTLALIGRVQLNGYALPAGHAAFANLNPFMRRLVMAALAKLDKAQDTLAVLRIARQIQAALATQQAPQASSNPKPSEGKPSKGEGVRGQGRAVRGQGRTVRGRAVRGQGRAVRGQGRAVRGQGRTVRGRAVRGQGRAVQGRWRAVRGRPVRGDEPSRGRRRQRASCQRARASRQRARARTRTRARAARALATARALPSRSNRMTLATWKP